MIVHLGAHHYFDPIIAVRYAPVAVAVLVVRDGVRRLLR